MKFPVYRLAIRGKFNCIPTTWCSALLFPVSNDDVSRQGWMSEFGFTVEFIVSSWHSPTKHYVQFKGQPKGLDARSGHMFWVFPLLLDVSDVAPLYKVPR